MREKEGSEEGRGKKGRKGKGKEREKRVSFRRTLMYSTNVY